MTALRIKQFGWLSLFCWLVISTSNWVVVSAGSQDKARTWVNSALEVMGGKARLSALKSLKIEGLGYRNHLADSEHPEGPWVPDFMQITELRDLEGRRLHRVSTIQFPGNDLGTTTLINAGGVGLTVSALNGNAFPARTAPTQDQWIVQSPERALLAAFEAPDLRAESDTVTQSVPHHVVAFTWEKMPVRIFINSYNSLPTAVEIVRDYPYDIGSGAWGDVTTRVVFSNWDLKPGGIHYPLQWDTAWNGLPWQSFTITKLSFNPVLQDDAFSIPEDARKAFAPRTIDELPLGSPDRPAREIAPHVIQIPGNWYTTLVAQSDGIVIVEAPISNGYSARVIAEAQRRYPNLPIKAAITTTNYWWHFGGIREYVSRGIPVYVLDLNKPILERVLAAPRRSHPDQLARDPKAAKFRVVSSRIVIGTGSNRLELYPVRAGAAQMMMVYFPEHKLLYTSEMAQPLGPGGSFLYPHDLSSLIEEVKQDKLIVDTVIGMHMSPTPWAKVVEAVATASAPTTSH